ncbi:hypothetical protein CC80DRAFT_25774 [Byssothecium circinans]|uniref:Uncharacterized protein n=1 Tax=Byssothecium circinans TaxID=147558 RepID=A0A6A5TZW9_9PLEO|nr:hypothetical protein CC80DRAFT_25774 [Byssothecium circinans]
MEVTAPIKGRIIITHQTNSINSSTKPYLSMTSRSLRVGVRSSSKSRIRARVRTPHHPPPRLHSVPFRQLAEAQNPHPDSQHPQAGAPSLSTSRSKPINASTFHDTKIRCSTTNSLTPTSLASSAAWMFTSPLRNGSEDFSLTSRATAPSAPSSKNCAYRQSWTTI